MAKTFKGYTPIEAPSFTLESPDGTRQLTVECVGMLPGSRFLDFLAHADEENPSEMSGAIWALLEACVVNWDEFKAFIDVPENGIGMEVLGEIAGHVGELYANRPTQPSPMASAG